MYIHIMYLSTYCKLSWLRLTLDSCILLHHGYLASHNSSSGLDVRLMLHDDLLSCTNILLGVNHLYIPFQKCFYHLSQLKPPHFKSSNSIPECTALIAVHTSCHVPFRPPCRWGHKPDPELMAHSLSLPHPQKEQYSSPCQPSAGPSLHPHTSPNRSFSRTYIL